MRGYHLTMIISLALLLAAAPAFSAPPAELLSPSETLARQALFARCSKKTIDVDALLTDPGTRKYLSALPHEEAVEMTLYSACRSATGTADGCAALEGLGGKFEGADNSCRKLESKIHMAQVALRKGDEAAFCQAFATGKDKKAAKAGPACSLIISAVRAGDALQACPALEKQGFIGQGDSCQEDLAFWKGDPKACAPIKEMFSRRECEESASLVAGLRKPEQCATSPFCQSLEKKSPAACNSLRKSIAATLCARAEEAEADLLKRRTTKEDHIRMQAEAQAKITEEIAARKAKFQADEMKKNKTQFQEGQPMKGHSKEVQAVMDRIEKGLPPGPLPGESDAKE